MIIGKASAEGEVRILCNLVIIKGIIMGLPAIGKRANKKKEFRGTITSACRRKKKEAKIGELKINLLGRG